VQGTYQRLLATRISLELANEGPQEGASEVRAQMRDQEVELVRQRGIAAAGTVDASRVPFAEADVARHAVPYRAGLIHPPP
jgi:hypothetical protein